MSLDNDWLELVSKNKLARAFKAVASTKDGRPALQCLNFAKDGSVNATDSHVAIRIEHFHELKEVFNFNLLYFRPDTCDYPDVARLIPGDKDFVEASFSMAGDDLKNLARFLKSQASDIVTFVGGADGKLIIKNPKSGMTYAGPSVVEGCKSGHDFATHFRAKYLYEALHFFETCFLPVTINLYAPLRPVLLTYGDNVKYLVAPVNVG